MRLTDRLTVIKPLVQWIDRVVPTSNDQYPTPWTTERQIIRLINQLYLSSCLSDEFAEQFRDMSFDDLDACAKSFRFDQCLQRDGLNKALEAHSKMPDLTLETERPPNLWLESQTVE